MAYQDVPGARLWYADSGADAPAVVFLHPAAGTSDSWSSQIHAFSAYRCITYDLRGWGKSTATSADNPGLLSDDLAALADALRLDRFHLVAAAYGGFGGLDFALRFPDRLLSLVLSTTQGGVVEPDYVATRERAVSAPIRGLPIELRELGPSYRAEDPDGVARWVAIERNAGANRPRQGLATQITYAALQTLHVPTLALAAGADLLAPPALMRLIAAQIPDCRFEVIAEAGHSAHWERPAQWNRIVLDFLAEQTPLLPV